MNNPKVSIIIAVKKWNIQLEECLHYCLEQDYPNFEIIVLPDEKFAYADERIMIVATGLASPSEKRDRALTLANGEVLAFIDDDAYPVQRWLGNAVHHFNNKQMAAVGGPAITPSGGNWREKAGGVVYSARIVAGNYRYRYVPEKKRLVDDYPTCNFIIRKEVLKQLGGFDTTFWPGEDTKLCLEITNHLRMKILYDPKVLVYHHRRPLFLPHLRQISRYALHRGYFVKHYPETSLRFSYFLPSLFVLLLSIGAIISVFSPKFRIFYFIALGFYLVAVLGAALPGRNPKVVSGSFVGIILSHLVYGIWFIKGIVSMKLPEQCR